MGSRFTLESVNTVANLTCGRIYACYDGIYSSYEITNHSIGEILVQFMALNYITVNHPNHNNDYELSHESTYVLTEVRRNVLIQIAVKRI